MMHRLMVCLPLPPVLTMSIMCCLKRFSIQLSRLQLCHLPSLHPAVRLLRLHPGIGPVALTIDTSTACSICCQAVPLVS